MAKKTVSFLALIVLLSFFWLSAQEKAIPQETESKVPELTAMHDIIYPIWHTAYPEKDYTALREYAPEVKRLAEKVYGAQLPGILRDKKAAWEKGVAELKKSVEDYLKAAGGPDDEALWNAAEVLHAKYEMLVRTIRPVLKEVDEFHKVLYVVYHKYLPGKDYENIKQSSTELKAKAEAVTQATLPKRLESRSEKYASAAAKLLEAAKELEETCGMMKGDEIEKAVERLHTKYQSLEKVFD